MKLTYLEVDRNRSHYDDLPTAVRSEFMDRLVMSWLYHDHALEGVVLSQSDLERFLSGKPVRNYCDGLIQKSLCRLRSSIAYLFECAERQEPLTLDFIKGLHERLCDEDDPAAGRYRKRSTSPGVYNLSIVPSNSISYYFHKFIDTWDEELVGCHPIRAAAMAHWEFMNVFPFDEKTGIVGRLMMNYILIRSGYPPAIIHASDRHHYFGALDGYRTDLVPILVEAISSTITAARTFSARNLEPDRPHAAL